MCIRLTSSNDETDKEAEENRAILDDGRAEQVEDDDADEDAEAKADERS